MACPDDETLVIFADDELDASARTAVEQHLAGCTSCRLFVQEMRSLAALGRSSLQSIGVPVPRQKHLDAQRSTRAHRLLAFTSLATAAAVLVVVSVAWIVTRDGHSPHQAVAPTDSVQAPVITPLADEAFEQWAAHYRQMRIPLIPMEEVANYDPPDIAPVWPMTPGLN